MLKRYKPGGGNHGDPKRGLAAHPGAEGAPGGKLEVLGGGWKADISQLRLAPFAG
jgi:hypothetical protein